LINEDKISGGVYDFVD